MFILLFMRFSSGIKLSVLSVNLMLFRWFFALFLFECENLERYGP